MYDNYGYGYESMNNVVSNGVGMIIWTVLAVILAIVGGILVYVLFLNSKKDFKLSKFLLWLKDFLSFKIMLVETILKVCYLISTIFVVLFSFTFITTNFLTFICCLLLGPIVIRLVYEGTLMFIMLWKNTNEINKKLK